MFEKRVYDYKAYPNQRKVECVICGDDFYIPNKKPYINAESQTCCKYCTNVSNGMKRQRGDYKLCKMCDKVFWITPCRNDKAHFCSRECQNIGYATFVNYNHKTESEKFAHKYYGSNWRSQRRKTRERDNYNCQKCGITEKDYGQELSVHHITPFVYFDDYKKANQLDNLLSVCESCHRKIHTGKNSPHNFDPKKIKAKHASGTVRRKQKEMAKEIVNLLFNSDLSLRKIAMKIGCSCGMVITIYNGQRWKELYDIPCELVKPRRKRTEKNKLMEQSSPTA